MRRDQTLRWTQFYTQAKATSRASQEESSFIELRNISAEHCAWRKNVARQSGAMQAASHTTELPQPLSGTIKRKRHFQLHVERCWRGKEERRGGCCSRHEDIFPLLRRRVLRTAKEWVGRIDSLMPFPMKNICNFSINWINFARFSFSHSFEWYFYWF